jgi:predicted HicB family RNase H-like nuclease
MTERQIARTLGISQAHVSRLLDGALTKLRAELTGAKDPPEAGDSGETSAISPLPSSKRTPVRALKNEDAAAGHGSDDRPAPSGRSAKVRPSNGYSGRILVRMPSELHEQLAQAAEREDVSLNRFVNDALSSSVDDSAHPAAASEATNGRRSSQVSGRALRLALATNVAVVLLAATAAVVLLVLAVQRGV